jgi:predicted RNA binding protein YcfA (HicA-like mRNA interferase family)
LLTKERPLPISGKEMLKRFEKAGWRVISRRGSHVKVGRGSEREIIPMHKELKKGLEHQLLKRLNAPAED